MPATAVCPNPLPYGDINGDDAVNPTDSLCVLRYTGGFLGNTNCPQQMQGAGIISRAAQPLLPPDLSEQARAMRRATPASADAP